MAVQTTGCINNFNQARTQVRGGDGGGVGGAGGRLFQNYAVYTPNFGLKISFF